MNDGPGPVVVSASPPAGFPVYGLDTSWPGSRWLEMFGDVLGDPVRWISLGHQSQAGESLIFLATYSRPPTDALAARTGLPPLREVASSAAVVLVNVTLPVQSVPRPAGFHRALIEHAGERADQFAQWPLMPLQVDGVAATGRVWWFAGGWTVVSEAVEGVYLTAVGLGNDPDGLSLAVLQHGSAYHFNLDQPLHYPRVISASKAARAGGDRPMPRREDGHSDQLRLLRKKAQ